MRKQAAIAAFGFAAIVGCAGAAAQSAYPTKPIRIIVAYTPAGTTDILARAIGQKFTAAWSQPVIVDNRPGANGTIGTEIAAKAPADGYTLLMATAATHAINPTLYPKLQYDAVKDFAPVSRVATVPNILVVSNALPVKNVKELIAYAKANPGKLAHGSPGIGSTGHLSAELFKSMTGIRMTHVAYKGSAPTLQDLMSGQIQVVIDNIPPYLPQVKAGKIRALAVTPAKRSPAAPELPTIDEAGVKGYEASTWFALFAPAGTPAAVVAKLSAETRRILDLPDMRERLLGLGAQPAGSTPEELARFVKAEVAKWAKVIRDANVTLN
ncbi:MAG: tripartite tricarboxylate transporter substrate binding protein [Betaproteobacteria bacterium]|nr:tripartite tricarboxylate transporter substrate binding protein [Betaproteobacteria bacterium]